MVKAHAAYITPIDSAHRALVARMGPRPGKVGLVIGGGTGHEPAFLGYVGKGLADAVAVGNIFSSPPPGPILQCAEGGVRRQRCAFCLRQLCRRRHEFRDGC